MNADERRDGIERVGLTDNEQLLRHLILMRTRKCDVIFLRLFDVEQRPTAKNGV